VFLPHLTLGLSGYELSLVVMPRIRGFATDEAAKPAGRIRNTRKALVLLAVVMSVFLLGSVLVTNLLIPTDALLHGSAANRSLAYLAHGGNLAGGGAAAEINPCFGEVFGLIYDLSTVLILCFAGMSVLVGMQKLLPQFLLRFGMEMKWASAW